MAKPIIYDDEQARGELRQFVEDADVDELAQLLSEMTDKPVVVYIELPNLKDGPAKGEWEREDSNVYRKGKKIGPYVPTKRKKSKR